jgi:hypothetical protein
LPAELREAALISVYDRTGILELAGALVARDIELYATGGTRAYLAENGLAAKDVGELTGFPSLFDGRVKTLHPRVFGAILADRANEAHERERREHGVPRIGTVVVNLYPFEATVARDGATLEEAVEQIDIGGVALIRAAAKNFAHVTVLVDPDHYSLAISAPEGVDLATRRVLATRAFERTAEYDSSIARYLEAGLPARELPGSLALTLPLATALRYGENPQSRAAFYLARAERLPEPRSSSIPSRAASPSGRPSPARRAKRSIPIRSRPSAASSPSTAASISPPPKRWPNSFSRSSPRPRTTTTRSSVCAARRTCGSSATIAACRNAWRASCKCAVRSAACWLRTTIRKPSPNAGRRSRSVCRAWRNGAICASPGTWCAT